MAGPGVAEKEEFSIHIELSVFPVSECPTYLKEGIGAVCIAGTAIIQVFDGRFRIIPGMVVTLMPWQLVSIKNRSEDFRMTFFLYYTYPVHRYTERAVQIAPGILGLYAETYSIQT